MLLHPGCRLYLTYTYPGVCRSTVPFQYVWLSDLAGEIATLTFYVMTGFYFRPHAENPYFALQDDEISRQVCFLKDRTRGMPYSIRDTRSALYGAGFLTMFFQALLTFSDCSTHVFDPTLWKSTALVPSGSCSVKVNLHMTVALAADSDD